MQPAVYKGEIVFKVKNTFLSILWEGCARIVGIVPGKSKNIKLFWIVIIFYELVGLVKRAAAGT